MTLTIRDAVQANLKARVGLLAPAKGGKTFTMLTFLFAMKNLGMAKKIGVIDTEHRSASKYKRDFGPFRVIEMEDDFSPEQYVAALDLLAEDGCDAVGIDSLSHAWSGKGGALEIKDKVSRQRGFNDYTAWGPVTAMHVRLIEAMLSYPGHLIATMRVKMEYVMEKDPVTGHNAVRKVGLQPVQRDGMEYEFDVLGDITQEHQMTITGTRCHALDGYSKVKPGEEVIRKLKAWLESDEAVEARAKPAPAIEIPPSPPVAAPVSDVATTSAANAASTPDSIPAPSPSPVIVSPAPVVAPVTTPRPADSFAAQMNAAATPDALEGIALAIGPAVRANAISESEKKMLVKLYLARKAQLAPAATAAA